MRSSDLLTDYRENGGLQDWIDLGKGKGKFKVIMEQKPKTIDAETIYAEGKNDHKIINAALYLKENEPKKSVTLVTKDINLRIKAKALGVIAEDYETGKVTIQNEEKSNTIEGVDSERIREIFTKGRIDENGILGASKLVNGYYILKNGKSSSLAFLTML